MSMIKQPALIAAFFLALSAASAQAAAPLGALMTGGALLNLCQSGKAGDQFACQSYIAGVVDYHRLMRGLKTAPAVDFCLPEKLPMADVKAIVSHYLMRYTEHRDFIAAPAVAMSLYQKYPCKRRR
jgi:hypothetical protein